MLRSRKGHISTVMDIMNLTNEISLGSLPSLQPGLTAGKPRTKSWHRRPNRL
jgi:hypothetical protein